MTLFAACWRIGEPAPYLHLARTFELVEHERSRFKITSILCNMFRRFVWFHFPFSPVWGKFHNLEGTKVGSHGQPEGILNLICLNRLIQIKLSKSDEETIDSLFDSIPICFPRKRMINMLNFVDLFRIISSTEIFYLTIFFIRIETFHLSTFANLCYIFFGY